MKETGHSISLRSLMGAMFFLRLGEYGLTSSTLVFFVQSFGGTLYDAGRIVAVNLALRVIGIPLWASASDRYGRQPILLLNCFGTAASMFALALSGDLSGIVIARIIAGIFGAGPIVLVATAADTVEVMQDRVRIMGKLEAAAALGGALIGPALGSWIYSFNAPITYICTEAFSLVAFVILLVSFKKTEGKAPKTRPVPSFSFRKLIPKNTNARGALVACFAYGFISISLDTVLVAYIKTLPHPGGQFAGILLAVAGATALLSQIFLLSRLSKRFGAKLVSTCALAVTGLSFLIVASPMAKTDSIGILPTLSMIAFGIGAGFTLPLLGSLVIARAVQTELGSLQGLARAYAFTGAAVGSMTLGKLYTGSAHEVPLIVCATLSFAAAAWVHFWKWRLQEANLDQTAIDNLVDILTGEKEGPKEIQDLKKAG